MKNDIMLWIVFEIDNVYVSLPSTFSSSLKTWKNGHEEIQFLISIFLCMSNVSLILSSHLFW